MKQNTVEHNSGVLVLSTVHETIRLRKEQMQKQEKEAKEAKKLALIQAREDKASAQLSKILQRRCMSK